MFREQVGRGAFLVRERVKRRKKIMRALTCEGLRWLRTENNKYWHHIGAPEYSTPLLEERRSVPIKNRLNSRMAVAIATKNNGFSV